MSIALRTLKRAKEFDDRIKKEGHDALLDALLEFDARQNLAGIQRYWDVWDEIVDALGGVDRLEEAITRADSPHRPTLIAALKGLNR